MKTHTVKAKPRPAFAPGDHARTTCYLPPVLSGSVVAVLDVHNDRGTVRYQVRSVEYEAKPVWAYEDDLEWILLPS